MEELKTYRLADICNSIQTGPFGSQLHKSDYVEFGTPIVMPKDITNGKINDNNISRISKNDVAKLFKHKLVSGNIIYPRRGDISKCALITSKEDGWVCGTGCIKVDINQQIANSTYVMYVLCQSETVNWIESNAVGTTMLNLNTSILSDLPIKLPSLNTQKKLANIVSSFDKKIDLNRRINDNLEQQAQALFKSWFVDFEPFKEGKFVDSEMGMIPEGWKVGRLCDFAIITMGQSPSGDSYNENKEGMVFYQGRSEFGNRFPSIKLYTTDPNRIAEKNSILISVRAPVGDINIASQDCCIGRGLASIKARGNYNSFLYYTVKSMKKEFDVYNGEGTVFGSINKDSLNSMPVIIPTTEEISNFEKITSVLDYNYEKCHRENIILTSLRDNLLPRLISGGLKINDLNC
ncbi:restriction endonuclease subunit S [Bacteroides thetaiotaomicron]|uniref:Restriction endonuclease subunit S n=1 Tax=Bacteroides thetaiotaomicron TaxID=818 RepID=A0A7J5K018_BACT4|nr:restriction endonuclease subunit S [Bacteroides thetaiotaomicron]